MLGGAAASKMREMKTELDMKSEYGPLDPRGSTTVEEFTGDEKSASRETSQGLIGGASLSRYLGWPVIMGRGLSLSAPAQKFRVHGSILLLLIFKVYSPFRLFYFSARGIAGAP